MRRVCKVDGCNKPVVSFGLCDMHRQRLKKHGHLKQTRPDDWGKREKHPLHDTWCWMRKMEKQFSVCDKWQDFWEFTKDVGERPSPQHQLRRMDNEKNYSPKNCEWVNVNKNHNHTKYLKNYRKNNKDSVKNCKLIKAYGITIDDYNKLYGLQDGKCAICGTDKTHNGTALAVDHNHKTGNVRGLLCSKCNTGLGCFKDSEALMQKAITYLNNHNNLGSSNIRAS